MAVFNLLTFIFVGCLSCVSTTVLFDYCISAVSITFIT